MTKPSLISMLAKMSHGTNDVTILILELVVLLKHILLRSQSQSQQVIHRVLIIAYHAYAWLVAWVGEKNKGISCSVGSCEGACNVMCLFSVSEGIEHSGVACSSCVWYVERKSACKSCCWCEM